MVCADDKYAYSNIYMLSISPSHHYYKINMLSDIIVLNSSTIFQTYDLISCDASCDCSHVPLHHLRKTKLKIKSKKIKKTKRKSK